MQDWEEQGEAAVLVQLRKALERTAEVTLLDVPSLKHRSGDRHSYGVLTLGWVSLLAPVIHPMSSGADQAVSICLNCSAMNERPRLPPTSKKCSFKSSTHLLFFGHPRETFPTGKACLWQLSTWLSGEDCCACRQTLTKYD